MRYISLIPLFLAANAHAAISFNEIFINPPGTDGGQEFIELRSSTNAAEAMTGLTLLVVEGDGTTAGSIDVALSLNSFTTGANGLFLWRDASSIIDTSSAAGVQGPNPLTTVQIADFNPDLENGSNTFLLVTGFTGAIGNDLDTNNDGALDVLPWLSVVDAVAIVENDGVSNFGYAQSLGFTNLGAFSGFNPDLIYRTPTGAWRAADVLGTNPGGPYTVDPDPARNSYGGSATDLATPGVTNVPEPASALLGSLGLLGLLRRRRSH